MGAGILQFTLGLDGKQYASAIKSADVETTKLTHTVERLGLTSVDSSHKVVESFHEIRQGAYGAREGMKALSHSAELFGYSVAPQATMATRALLEGVKAAGVVARITGLGFGSLGLAAIGAAAAAAIAVTGFQALQARMAENGSLEALKNQFFDFKEKLIPTLDKLMKLGRIDIKTGSGLERMISDATTVEERLKAIRAAQQAIMKVNKEDRQFTIGQSLDAMLKDEKMLTMDDKSRDKAEFLKGQDAKFKEAIDLATAAGRPEKQVKDAFNAANKAGLEKIDEKYAKKDEPHHLSGPWDQENAMQKMGFVFKGGAGGDPQTQTARNTGKMVGLLQAIHQKISHSDTTPFADPFANASAV